MAEAMKLPGQLVFGLDIGTRSIVGTVGYRVGEKFHVVAQCIREHGTRAMLDGQIHDIKKVGDTIMAVKEALEQDIGSPLAEVCIAAAGRVLPGPGISRGGRRDGRRAGFRTGRRPGLCGGIRHSLWGGAGEKPLYWPHLHHPRPRPPGSRRCASSWEHCAAV